MEKNRIHLYFKDSCRQLEVWQNAEAPSMVLKGESGFQEFRNKALGGKFDVCD